MSIVSRSTQQFSGFDPRIIPGCTLWLDAADSSSVTTSGSNVTSWRDKSVSANNATASSNWPTYPGTKQNTRNVINFSGSSQRFNLTPNKLPTGTSSMTIFSVANQASGPGGRIIVFGTASVGQYIDIGFGINFPTSSGLGILAGTTTYDATYANNTYYVCSAVIANSTAPQGWRNGNAFSTSASSGTYNIGTNLAYIGANNTLSTFLNGNIGEIIVYNSALSTTDRRQVEGYLAWKWGASLTSHPYSSYPPFMVPFRATDISNCYCWLDASDKSSFTIDGSNNVTAIVDKANGNSFTVGGTPTWSASGFNTSYPGFTMTNGRFIKAITTMTKYQHTAFIVTKLNSTPTAGWPCVAFAGAVGGSTQFYRVIDYTSTPSYRSIAFTASLFSATTTYANANLIFSGTFDGSRAITSRILRGSENNFSVSGTGTAFSTDGAAIMIGTDGNTPGTNTWPGVIAEVIVYGNSNLSATQIRVIEGYLAWKWGLRSTITSTHPFYDLPPLRVTA